MYEPNRNGDFSNLPAWRLRIIRIDIAGSREKHRAAERTIMAGVSLSPLRTGPVYANMPRHRGPALVRERAKAHDRIGAEEM